MMACEEIFLRKFYFLILWMVGQTDKWMDNAHENGRMDGQKDKDKWTTNISTNRQKDKGKWTTDICTEGQKNKEKWTID
jgi:hypothetical protein